MANRACLINADMPGVPPQLHPPGAGSEPSQALRVAEAANRLPLPWLLCFRPEDLLPAVVRLQNGPEQFSTVALNLPCTSVAAARERLQQALPIYVALTGDAALAKSYWRRACEGLNDLPHPWLTMDPIEVLCLNDFDEDARTLAESLGGDASALPDLKWLSGYDDGFAPYGAAAYFDGDPGALDHVARLGNSAALDPGYVRPSPLEGVSRARKEAPPQVAARAPLAANDSAKLHEGLTRGPLSRPGTWLLLGMLAALLLSLLRR
ncbi:hypothetical protein [Pelomonas sp. BJYL3]|uniref:hypothetical protein n=1 Tax=Pelomonas sp. BJYL3 TaxID=2976697 RepID=UPI0022B37FE1|nr:hypothetical protein [Pelomonas sp. BJYL3]